MEGLTRWLYPVGLHPSDTFLTRDFITGREGSMALVPGAAARFQREEFDTHVRINSRGLRDREIAYQKPEGTYRILVLGDSQTFGFGVEAEETYAKALERRLRKRSTVETLNTGVPGAGTAHELHFLETEGWKYEPDAVIVGFFFNDPLENSQCRLYALEGDRLLRPAVPSEEAVPLYRVYENPPNPQEVQKVHAPVAVRPRPSWLVQHSHLVRLLRQSAANLGARRAAGPVRAPALELTARLLQEIARQCGEREVRLLVVLIPWREECADLAIKSLTERYARALRHLPDREQQVLDLLPGMRSRGYDDLLFRKDQHLTPAGHAMAAREVERALLRFEPRLRGDGSAG